MRDELLALLEEGPQFTATLANWLRQPALQVDATLKAMARDGLLRRVGAERKWALAGYEASPARPHLAECAAVKRAAKTKSVTAEQRRWNDYGQPRRPAHSNEDTVILRQPAPPPPPRGDSWWVGLSREDLSAQVAVHQNRMHHSKGALLVKGVSDL